MGRWTQPSSIHPQMDILYQQTIKSVATCPLHNCKWWPLIKPNIQVIEMSGPKKDGELPN